MAELIFHSTKHYFGQLFAFLKVKIYFLNNRSDCRFIEDTEVSSDLLQIWGHGLSGPCETLHYSTYTRRLGLQGH